MYKNFAKGIFSLNITTLPFKKVDEKNNLFVLHMNMHVIPYLLNMQNEI